MRKAKNTMKTVRNVNVGKVLHTLMELLVFLVTYQNIGIRKKKNVRAVMMVPFTKVSKKSVLNALHRPPFLMELSACPVRSLHTMTKTKNNVCHARKICNTTKNQNYANVHKAYQLKETRVAKHALLANSTLEIIHANVLQLIPTMMETSV